MNLFVFDEDPVKAAEDHPNKYLVKMPLETAQLLCSAYHVLFSTKQLDIPYKLTHKNHPCAIWVRTSKENFKWAVQYGQALCHSFQRAYKKEHACLKVINWALKI